MVLLALLRHPKHSVMVAIAYRFPSTDNFASALLAVISASWEGQVDTSAVQLTLKVLVTTIDALGHF